MITFLPHPTLSPVQDRPRRKCWPVLNGAVPPHTGGPVLLGWPVRVGCPGTTHNTQNASRRAKKTRCICPHAQELRRAFRSRDNAYRMERGTVSSRDSVTPRTPIPGRLPPTVKLIRSAGFLPTSGEREEIVPECRLDSLGGTLRSDQVEDFHDQQSTYAIERARARCRRCPLQRKCLLAAVESDEPFGVWGGLTPKERRRPLLVQAELDKINDEEAAA